MRLGYNAPMRKILGIIAALALCACTTTQTGTRRLHPVLAGVLDAGAAIGCAELRAELTAKGHPDAARLASAGCDGARRLVHIELPAPDGAHFALYCDLLLDDDGYTGALCYDTLLELLESLPAADPPTTGEAFCDEDRDGWAYRYTLDGRIVRYPDAGCRERGFDAGG